MDRDQWLSRRTYRGVDFDPARLAQIAAERGERISVCLPTLNVQDTVGPIVEAIRRELIVRVPLVHEVVVIDSDSCDDTRRRAAEAGAYVVRANDVLSHIDHVRGKGEALWKSLAVVEGDIVVWLDSDVTDPDPGFVSGLVGPLLDDPDVSYVKAVYRRALGDAPDEGGRVTEICARPLLNLFYPELAGMAQPLSGEAAGRREVLMELPFFGGYAVEIGLLIDMLNRHGLSAMAQVDLGARRHTNQSTTALGAMASTITQAVLARLADEGRAPNDLTARGDYLRPVRTAHGWMMSAVDARPVERPPMRSVLGLVP